MRAGTPTTATAGRALRHRTVDPLAVPVTPDRVASEPPERRGVARDQVRLLVAGRDGVAHSRFDRLPTHLRPGDVLVVNRSATRAAAHDGRRADGRPCVVHLATHRGGVVWEVELRRPDGTGPQRDGAAGEVVRLGTDGTLRLLAPVRGEPRDAPRLWRAVVALPRSAGRPITYGHLSDPPPLAAFQTVFGVEPGSAEMASAGRPFTTALVTRLVTAGVHVVPVTLHAGVSSPEAGERPRPERYEVPPATAELVTARRRAGSRVVAVGTTVTRALEGAVVGGRVRPGAGWTTRVVTPDDPPRVVDGLLTGWHEPAASHLDLLAAVAGRSLLEAAYAAAIDAGYLWHEFGDSCLLLP